MLVCEINVLRISSKRSGSPGLDSVVSLATEFVISENIVHAAVIIPIDNSTLNISRDLNHNLALDSHSRPSIFGIVVERGSDVIARTRGYVAPSAAPIPEENAESIPRRGRPSPSRVAANRATIYILITRRRPGNGPSWKHVVQRGGGGFVATLPRGAVDARSPSSRGIIVLGRRADSVPSRTLSCHPTLGARARRSVSRVDIMCAPGGASREARYRVRARARVRPARERAECARARNSRECPWPPGVVDCINISELSTSAFCARAKLHFLIAAVKRAQSRRFQYSLAVSFRDRRGRISRFSKRRRNVRGIMYGTDGSRWIEIVATRKNI